MTNPIFCKLCRRVFTKKTSLNRHLDLKRCLNLNKKISVTKQSVIDLIKKVSDVSQIEYIIQNIRTQINIIPDYNFFDHLKNHLGFESTIEFIKNCALSRLSGDIRILQKVYLTGDYPALVTTNRNRTKFAYYNDQNELVLESNPNALIRQLVNNLQITYLHTTGYFDYDGRGKNGIDSIESYDLQAWNNHIYELIDDSYQKKLFEYLDIQYEGDLKINFRNRNN